MTLASGLALLAAILVLQFSRDPGTGSTATYLATGLALAAGLLLLRSMLHRSTRLERLRPLVRQWASFVLAALGVVGFALVGGLPATDELLAIGILSLAGSLWILSAESEKTMHWSGGMALMTCLIWLPAVPFEARTAAVIMITVSGAVFLIAYAEAKRANRSRPKAAVVIWSLAWAGMGVGLVLAAKRWVNPIDLNPSYAGWVEASGGIGEGSDAARRGVGAGPDEISADAADSVGFDHSDTFAESGRDGLYDLWLESYGEPSQRADGQKSTALNPDGVRIVQSTDREDLQAGRRFELRRAPARRPAITGDKAASAKLWIKGPLPAYVPLEVFEEFDGDAWLAVPHGKPTVPVRLNPATGTMEVLNRPISPAYWGSKQYEIRVGALGGDVLPLPMHVEGFRMGRVRQPSFFASTASGLIRLARRSLPPGAVIHATAKAVSDRRLAAVEPALPSHSNARVLETARVPEIIRATAGEWARGQGRGWLQIQQVVGRLREAATFDPAHRVPEGGDPMVDLLQARQGTDYQFATTAAMMLRTLSYPTRVVSGFYAGPDRLDRRSQSVPLDASAVHFWVEVRLADGTWIGVDPTPGFPMLALPRPLRQVVGEAFQATSQLIKRNIGMICLGGSLAIAAWLLRRPILDAVATTYCAATGYAPHTAARVIEFRARLAGRKRPASMPIGVFFNQLGITDQCAFMRAVNGWLYSQSAVEPVPLGEIRTVLARCTIARIRSAYLGPVI